MRVWRAVEKPPASLHQRAGHVDVVVGEVEEELLDAEEHLGLGEQAELDHLAEEATDLQLGLDVHLVLLPHLPAELLLEVLGQARGHFRHAWLEGGGQSGEEGQQVRPVTVNVEEVPETKR